MRNPDPPFLELGFYFRHSSGRDAFRKLAKTIVDDLHARPKEVTLRNSVESNLLRSCESTISSLRVSSNADFWELVDNENLFAVKLAVENGTKIIPDAAEYVTVLPIDSSDAGANGNTVAIWIEGALFTAASTQSAVSSKTRSIGQKTRSVFVNLVRRLNPTYAAITIDYGLESPCDLREDPRTYAFRDFYLQFEHFGPQLLHEIKSRFSKADFEDIGCGLLVTTSKSFVKNLDAFEFSPTESYELSAFVGRMISKNGAL